MQVPTVRRTGLLKVGGLLASFGFLALLVGGIVLAGQQVVQVAAAKGRARVGNPITFDARDGKDYAVTLIPDPGSADFTEGHIADLECTVTHPGGATDDLDVRRASTRVTSSVGILAARFTGHGGRTTVACEWSEGHEYQGSYAVARSRSSVRIAGIALVAGGIVGLVVGIPLIVLGFRGRPEVAPPA